MAEAETVTMPQATTEQPAENAGNVMGQGGMSFEAQMVGLTWIAFLISAIVLGKLLWKPILKFVEAREAEIEGSLEDAAKARKAAEEADKKAAETIEAAELKAKAEADAQAAAARQHVATMEAEAREQIAAKRKVAEEALAEERTATLRKLSEQAGGEIAFALEKLLPGLLTEEQRTAYQERIASELTLR